MPLSHTPLSLLTRNPQAFYPKNRGKWKALSSWEPPERGARTLRPEDDTLLENRWPAEVRIKKGYTWSEQLGIAIKLLVDDGKMTLVDWVKEVRQCPPLVCS